MKERRKYSRSYKLAAVKKVVEQGMSGADVARELGIEGNLIYNWKAKFEREGVLHDLDSASPEEENKRLRERVRQSLVFRIRCSTVGEDFAEAVTPTEPATSDNDRNKSVTETPIKPTSQLDLF